MRFRGFAAVLIVMVMASFGVSALVQAASPKKEVDFVRQASVGNQFEIVSGQLAIKRATMPEVRDFAQMIVNDHTKLGDTLKSTLASSDLGIVPVQSFDIKHQKTLGALKSVQAENFDHLYIQTQTDAHDEAVSLFTDYAKNGDNAALMKFSSEMLPILEQHQERINNLRQPLISARP